MRTNQANVHENVNKWVFTIIIFAMIKGLFVYHYSGKFKLLRCEPTIILYSNKAPLTLEANFNLYREVVIVRFQIRTSCTDTMIKFFCLNTFPKLKLLGCGPAIILYSSNHQLVQIAKHLNPYNY